MRMCTAHFETFTDGTRTLHDEAGRYEKRGGEFLLRYSVEGDAAELGADGRRVTMSREGSLGLEAAFAPGEETEMKFAASSFSGTCRLYTHALQLMETEDGFFLSLVYDMIFTDGRRRVELALTVREGAEL